MDPRVDRGDVVGAAGFEQDSAAGIGQEGHQWENIFLKERLAAGDFDQGTIVAQDSGNDLA
jgi:hypothetical protein